MKKLVGILLLVVMMFSLTACGGSFDGNFSKEATQEEIKATVQSIETSNQTPAPEEEDDGYQMKMFMEYDVKSSNELFNIYSKTDYSGKLSEVNDKAKGEFKCYSKSVMGEKTTIVDSKVFIDEDTVYVNNTSESNGTKVEKKIKASADSALLGLYVDIDTLSNEGYELQAEDALQALDDIAELGGKVYLDTANGVKIKIAYDKESEFVAELTYIVDSVLKSVVPSLTTTVDLKDCYQVLVFDENNRFEGIKVFCDLTISATYNEESITATMKINTEFSGFDGEVKLPALEGYTQIGI